MLKEVGISGVIDCHTHSGGTDAYNYFAGNIPHSQSVADLLLKTRMSGVDRVITFPFPGSTYYNTQKLIEEGKREPSGLQRFPYEVENIVLARECGSYQEEVIPFACVDPTTEVQKQLDLISDLHSQGKIFGLKLHTLAAGCDATMLITSGIAEFAEGRNLPIIVHSGVDLVSHPSHVLEVGKKFPRLRLCIAHLAGLDSDCLTEISKMDNVYVDCVPFLQICKAVEDKGTNVSYPNLIDPANPVQSLLNYLNVLQDNLIWGTDEPWTTSIEADGTVRSNHTYFDEVKVLVDLARLSEKGLAKITNENTINFLFG